MIQQIYAVNADVSLASKMLVEKSTTHTGNSPAGKSNASANSSASTTKKFDASKFKAQFKEADKIVLANFV